MNLFGIQIKTYDWIPKDEVALVKPGKALRLDDKNGKHITKQFVIEEPEIVKLKGVES